MFMSSSYQTSLSLCVWQSPNMSSLQNTTHFNNIKHNSYKIERQTTSSLRAMSAEMIDIAEETIIDCIICPFCKDFIQPPSSCCENGHFVCFVCKEKINKCPSCGSDKYPNKKNSVFDMILENIYYPCNYQVNGCSAYFKFDELKDHIRICKFNSQPCVFQSAGCPAFLKPDEKAEHESNCEYGTCCRVFAKHKGIICSECTWKGSKVQLPHHVTTSHQFSWSPNQIESNVVLTWILPMNNDFEKIELIHLKDVDEMFYFYSKSIAYRRHFVAVQYIGNKDNLNDFMYSIEFIHENKKVGFEDSVIPYNVSKEDIYKWNNCFSVDYEFLKNHFLAERIIDCYLRVFRKDQRTMQVKRYVAYLDNVIRENC